MVTLPYCSHTYVVLAVRGRTGDDALQNLLHNLLPGYSVNLEQVERDMPNAQHGRQRIGIHI